MPTNVRSFLVGETVHLTSRVSRPGTKVPADPDEVLLVSLRSGSVEALDGPMAFTRQGPGEYTLTLHTAGLAPGTYDLLVSHSSGDDRVMLATDTFVLQPV